MVEDHEIEELRKYYTAVIRRLEDQIKVLEDRLTGSEDLISIIKQRHQDDWLKRSAFGEDT